MRQCNEIETKTEYDVSHNLLLLFLGYEGTKEVLSKECIAAVKEFAVTLYNKESRLANYVKKEVTNSMDASTTSPVEAMNFVLKHGQKKLHSNMDIDNSLSNAIDSTTSRIERRQNEAFREMHRTNLSSRAPTKDDLIRKGQGLVDVSFDARLYFKGCQGEFLHATVKELSAIEFQDCEILHDIVQ